MKILLTLLLTITGLTLTAQLILVSDIHRSFSDGTLKISYLTDFNLDAYYGVQADWKIGKHFILNSGLRFNSTIKKNSQGFKKSNPILFQSALASINK